ncbi:malonyl CoA-acyl carrier protein transacylase, partial [Eremomyces bilateralis CBS 781.70]
GQLRWSSNSTVETKASSKKRPRTAIFFPGQGVQRVGMLQPWLSTFPRTAQPFLDELDALLPMTPSLTSIIQSGSNATLTATANSQPAIMATSVLILRILQQEFGLDLPGRVDFTLGHSLGEFAALVAGGYLAYADAVKMVRARGEAMAACSVEARKVAGDVGMVALVCEDEGRMKDLIRDITEFVTAGQGKSDSAEDLAPVQQVLIANVNSRNQIVLSGTIERIRALLTNLRQFGGHDPRAVRLKSDSPFHSPMMAPAEKSVRKLLSEKSCVTGGDMVAFPGDLIAISNITAQPFRSKADVEDLLARQCVETVQWWESVRYLDREEKVRRWIGVGPGKVGRNLVGKEVGMKGAGKGGGVWGITSPKEAEECMRGLEQTEEAGEE